MKQTLSLYGACGKLGRMGRITKLSAETRWALVACLLVGAWMLSGFWSGVSNTMKPEAEPLPHVQVQKVQPSTYRRQVTVSGFTQADKGATLSSQTAGRVDSVRVARGATVQKGDVLMTLDPADRLIRQRAAESELTRTYKLVKAARELAKSGYMAGTVLAEREAAYQAAQEKVANAMLDMAYTRLTAPFDGVVEDLMVTEGDYVNVGTSMVKLVGRDDILLVGYVAQADRHVVQAGDTVSATLVDGTDVPATLRSVATDADAATRTYRVEALIDGRRYPVPTGMSAELVLAAESVQALHVDHDWLVLNDVGTIGLMSVTVPASDTVASFQPVTLLADNEGGMWVQTSSEQGMWLVTRGQAALRQGTRVDAVPIGDLTP